MIVFAFLGVSIGRFFTKKLLKLSLSGNDSSTISDRLTLTSFWHKNIEKLCTGSPNSPLPNAKMTLQRTKLIYESSLREDSQVNCFMQSVLWILGGWGVLQVDALKNSVKNRFLTKQIFEFSCFSQPLKA